MNKQREFIKNLKEIKDYWLSQEGMSSEEIVDGVLFSILVLIDGDSGQNDFHELEIIDVESNEQISCGYLHELYNSI